jgi:hypothetical protein
MNYFYMIMNGFKLIMANEDLFGPEIEEEDDDGDLDRQPISSLLGHTKMHI